MSPRRSTVLFIHISDTFVMFRGPVFLHFIFTVQTSLLRFLFRPLANSCLRNNYLHPMATTASQALSKLRMAHLLEPTLGIFKFLKIVYLFGKSDIPAAVLPSVTHPLTFSASVYAENQK